MEVKLELKPSDAIWRTFPNPDSRKCEEVFWLTGTGMPEHLKAQSKEKEWSSSQLILLV